MAAHQRSGTIAYFIDEVHTAGLVNVHFAVDQTGKRDGNRSATGALHNHVNDMLREGVERNPSEFAQFLANLVVAFVDSVYR